ncbi:polysaccharide deacetylase family protein [Bacillus sp. SL00103]
MLGKIRKGGNEIGNHSYSHPLLTRLPLKQAVKQVEGANKSLKKQAGSTDSL